MATGRSVLIIFPPMDKLAGTVHSGASWMFLPTVLASIFSPAKHRHWDPSKTRRGFSQLLIRHHPMEFWRQMGNSSYVRSEERRVEKECRSRWSPYPST